MTGIILTVIGVLLLYSFVRFRIRHSVDLKFVEFMEQKCQQSPNEWRPLLGLASAYANAELYAKARSLYMDIKNDPSLMAQLAPGTLESIETNIKFCEKPLPWSKGAKDHHSFRYLHHFFLKRIGGQRYSFITEEDGITTVEVILILLVLIALVLIFKKELTGLVNSILSKAVKQANQV